MNVARLKDCKNKCEHKIRFLLPILSKVKKKKEVETLNNIPHLQSQKKMERCLESPNPLISGLQLTS